MSELTRRRLEPELLDSLAPDHPDALHNRRDLRLTNAVTGNHRWLVATTRSLRRSGEAVLEVASGTGELTRRLHDAGVPVDGLDLWPAPDPWPEERRWHRADLRAFDGYAAYPVVLGNLIFHQFADDELAALGAKLRRTARVILACEPVRRRRSQVLFALFGRLFGANHVSLHDAHVSIAAGFLGEELPATLGLDPASWQVNVTLTTLGMYRMVAVRNP